VFCDPAPEQLLCALDAIRDRVLMDVELLGDARAAAARDEERQNGLAQALRRLGRRREGAELAGDEGACPGQVACEERDELDTPVAGDRGSNWSKK
jgi:hypothetical protein